MLICSSVEIFLELSKIFLESKHESGEMLTSQVTAYFKKAFYEYLCCDSEAVNYVLKFLMNNEEDDIPSTVMYMLHPFQFV